MIGAGGEFGLQTGGRWWQIVGTRCKNRRQDGAGDCRGALPQKRGGGSPRGGPAPRPAFAGKPTARTPSHLETSPQTVAHFAKPARTPRRKRAESPKIIRKTARRTVKTLNKGPNFRMVDTYATPFLFDWPSGAPAWHYPGDHPHLVRKPRPCSRNDARRPLASARRVAQGMVGDARPLQARFAEIGISLHADIAAAQTYLITGIAGRLGRSWLTSQSSLIVWHRRNGQDRGRL